MIEIAKKSAKQEGLRIKGWVDTDRNCPPKLQKIRGFMHEGAGWTVIGIAKNMQK